MIRKTVSLFTIVLVLVVSVADVRGDDPLRIGFEYRQGARIPERSTQLANFVASGLNTMVYAAYLISPTVTEMEYNAGTGEVTIVDWPRTADPQDVPLREPNDFVAFVKQATIKQRF